MAYMVLDTTTNIMWHYKKATSNAWLRVGGSISSGLTGVLPVANGGTNTSTAFTAGSVVFAGASGTYSQDNNSLFYDDTNNRLGIGTTGPAYKLDVNGNGNFRNINLNGANEGGVLSIKQSATYTTAVNMKNRNDTQTWGWAVDAAAVDDKLLAFIDQTNGRVILKLAALTGEVSMYSLAGTDSRSVLADANGVLSAPVSSINTKENVQTLNYGLNELLQINPVSFNYINKDKWGEQRNLGFIVEDMYPIIPEVTGTMNNGDMYLDMTKLIPILTKAIQEQQALIKALEQRIINLENK
jgi:hypothetical protein